MDKVELFAKQVVRLNSDVYHKRLDPEKMSVQVAALEKDAKLLSITRNDILQVAMTKQGEFQRELQQETGLPYVIENINIPFGGQASY